MTGAVQPQNQSARWHLRDSDHTSFSPTHYFQSHKETFMHIFIHISTQFPGCLSKPLPCLNPQMSPLHLLGILVGTSGNCKVSSDLSPARKRWNTSLTLNLELSLLSGKTRAPASQFIIHNPQLGTGLHFLQANFWLQMSRNRSRQDTKTPFPLLSSMGKTQRALF